MSERERFERLRLIRSPRIGPVSYRQLLARFGSAGEALRAPTIATQSPTEWPRAMRPFAVSRTAVQ